MFSIILYVLLLFGLLVFSYRSNTSALGKILCTLYFVCGLVCIPVVYDPYLSTYGQQFNFDLSCVPYIYLFVAYVMYFWPFLGSDLSKKVASITIQNRRVYVLFSFFLLFCMVISIGCYFTSVYSLFLSGDWVGNRNLVYTDELPLPYANEFIHWCMRGARNFRHVAFILAFVFLKDKHNEMVAFVLLVLSGLNIVLASLYASARGTLFIEGIVFLSIFVVFSPFLSKKLLRFFYALIVICGGVLLFFSILITVSRYSGSGSMRSVVEYFGQAPLFFNYAVWDINHYMWGEFGWGKLLHDYIDTGFVRDKLLTSFYTFVGWAYFDWGPIGTMILGVLINLLFRPLLSKIKWYVSDLYILVAYYAFLVNGVFVIGHNHCKEIISNFVAFLLLKYVVEKIRLKI